MMKPPPAIGQYCSTLRAGVLTVSVTALSSSDERL